MEARIFKDWAKKAVVKSGALRALAHSKPPAAVILAYHSVRDEPREDADWIGPGITHATKIFSRHMEMVARQFHPVALSDILDFLQGNRELPPRAVAVTFDDGFADNIHAAAPVLARFGVPAAFYLAVSLIGTQEAPWYSRIRHAFMTTRCKVWQSRALGEARDISSRSLLDSALLTAYDLGSSLEGKPQQEFVLTVERELQVEPAPPRNRLMLNWEEARALRRDGHIVGSHTLTHPNVAHVKERNALRVEMVESKRRMEEHLQEPVSHFSYPHPALIPQWNEATLSMTREAGYATAVTTTRGPVRKGVNPLLLPRINAALPDHEFLWNLERTFLRAAPASLSSVS